MGLAEQDWSLPKRPCLMTSHNYVSLFSTSFPGFYLFSTQALVVTWLPKSGSQKQGRGRRVNCRYDETFLSGLKRIGSLPPCSLSADGRGIWKCQQHPKAVWHNARESNTENKVGIHLVYHGPAEALPEYRPLLSGKLTFPEERGVLHTGYWSKK